MDEKFTFFNYWQELWRDASPVTRRRGRLALLLYLGLWALGAYLAFNQIAGIAALRDMGRPLAALVVGPLGVVWMLLEMTGFIVENPANPGLGWLLPFTLHGGFLVLVVYVGQLPLNPTFLHKRAAAKYLKGQGQLAGEEAAALLAVKTGSPLAVVRDKQKKAVKVGVDFATGQGHILVTAPTRAGKGLHLFDVLTHWPGAAVVVDPKSEQHLRTADYRRRYVGPVYHLPGHQVHLAHYYNFLDLDDLQELHNQLLRPAEDMQRIFADKSLSLFRAVGQFAQAKKLNPLRVLLDAAEDDFQQVLAGLDSVPAARPFLRQFTNGQPPDKLTPADRFVSSAYGTFATRLIPYQKHIDTICPRTPEHVLPRDWVRQKATLYITYSLNELQGVGGVVSAILAGLMRHHMKHGGKGRLLVAIDEMAAVGLRNLDTYLATVGGYGVTLLLYAQSTSQITGVYGRAGADAILSNCAHQVWYPPNDYETAKHISDLFGTTLKPNRAYSTASRLLRQENGQIKSVPQLSTSESLMEAPTYSPTEVMALSEGRVFVFTEKGQQVRFTGQRLDSREIFSQLPPPPRPPRLPTAPRRYTAWLAQTCGNGANRDIGEADDGNPEGAVTAAGADPATASPPSPEANSGAASETAGKDGPPVQKGTADGARRGRLDDSALK